MPFSFLRSLLGVFWDQDLPVTALGSGKRRWQRWPSAQICHYFGLWWKDLPCKELEVTSSTACARKEAERPPLFSLVLPCAVFPHTCTSAGSWKERRSRGAFGPLGHPFHSQLWGAGSNRAVEQQYINETIISINKVLFEVTYSNWN